MKYRISEMVLNEYVNHPVENQIDEVEASSFEEANRIAHLRYPNRGQLKVSQKPVVKNSHLISE
jgi:hypothetical protein